MSLQTAKDFLVKISTDEEAAQKADEAYFGALLNLASQLGYEDVDKDDLAKAMQQVSSAGELSQEELGQVAGGARSSFFDSTGFGSKFFHRGF